MAQNSKEFIHAYFTKLLTQHDKIFGIHAIENEQKNIYFNQSDAFFAFVYLLSQMKSNFTNGRMGILLNDTVELLSFKNTVLQSQERQTQLYLSYKAQNPQPEDQMQFLSSLNAVYQEHKEHLMQLLNTKFYYLDLYVLHQIHEDSFLMQFLHLKNLENIQSVLDYTQQENHRLPIQVDPALLLSQEATPYTQDDIAFFKALDDPEKKAQKAQTSAIIDQLIKYKQYIPYFTNLSNSNIKKLINQVQFKRFKKDELLIKEDGTDKDIFFLMDGECNIVLHNRKISTIQAKNIFGEFSFITNEKRSASIQANTPCIVISFNINLDDFDKDPLMYPHLYKNITAELVKKFYQMNQTKK